MKGAFYIVAWPLTQYVQDGFLPVRRMSMIGRLGRVGLQEEVDL